MLEKIALDLFQQLKNSEIFDEKLQDEYVVLGAQMGSVRISSHLAKALGIDGRSIYSEKS